VAGGGGAYFNVDQPYPTTIQGLNVQGGMQSVRVPFTATRRIEKQVVLQAVCIDDRNVPHPASQVVPGRDVANSYDGELYRCLAGTKLQWTVSEAEGAAGETTACNKGDALWHGAGGRLECRPDPRRDLHRVSRGDGRGRRLHRHDHDGRRGRRPGFLNPLFSLATDPGV